MSTRIGRVRLSLPAPMSGQRDAEALVRDLRSALSGAFAAATATHPGPAVLTVRKLRVSVAAPLQRINGRDLATAIADACVSAAVTRSREPAASGDRAPAILAALGTGGDVRCTNRAEAAAAWLVALLTDDPSMRNIPSPFDDIAHLPSAAALLEVAARVGDLHGILEALGLRWARSVVARCTAAEAERLLHVLARDESGAPDAAARADAAALLRRQSAALAPAVRVALTALELNAQGALQPVAGARAALAATFESGLTGCWLLLPFLGRHVERWSETERRAIAVALAERTGGAAALDDAAVIALCGDLAPLDIVAQIPRGARLDRILVATLRDFARTLPGFEAARCGYLLRVLLSGSGFVRDAGSVVSATLPQSQLRIVLERSSRLGIVAAPWARPVLELVGDDA